MSWPRRLSSLDRARLILYISCDICSCLCWLWRPCVVFFAAKLRLIDDFTQLLLNPLNPPRQASASASQRRQQLLQPAQASPSASPPPVKRQQQVAGSLLSVRPRRRPSPLLALAVHQQLRRLLRLRRLYPLLAPLHRYQLPHSALKRRVRQRPQASVASGNLPPLPRPLKPQRRPLSAASRRLRNLLLLSLPQPLYRPPLPSPSAPNRPSKLRRRQQVRHLRHRVEEAVAVCSGNNFSALRRLRQRLRQLHLRPLLHRHSEALAASESLLSRLRRRRPNLPFPSLPPPPLLPRRRRRRMLLQRPRCRPFR